MNIVPFDSSANLPAYLSDATALLDINKEVVRAAAFPTMSIKGMKFTLNKDGVKKVLTKPDDPDEVAQSIGVVFLRANLHAKTFYAKTYVEGNSDGQVPDCYSYDGVAPSPNSTQPQAKKCAICPRNQWGAKTRADGSVGEGKECADNARIAISTPDNIEPILLRVPPASLKALRETLKVVAARKIPYNAVIVKVGFDREAPSPKLTFKPIGLMDDAGYARVKELYDDEVVRAIVGLDDLVAETPKEPEAGKVGTDELDAALAAREATTKAKAAAKPAPKVEDELDEVLAKPTPKAKPKAEPKPEPKPQVQAADEDDEPVIKPKPAASSSSTDLLADLDDLLGNKDD